ncbi:hypothetical protein E2N92_06100 [Methanofollis formosanus]|uniref:Uncharacterized protein n=1 Tax=Methanofollis formosanus TaxID=299308 RepID=A0A8G1A1L7_9EURY|nr:hypothetical protein [Methanofollis formosanus]QYZ79028.1 hypothetical protein E2N92_06100 [Methanofollis formosanus]
MIFPEECKYVGIATSQPLGEKVYFLSRWLIRETAEGPEVLAVRLADGNGLMREVKAGWVLATPDETVVWPEPVNFNDRSRLLRLARESGKRCTIFTSPDESRTFILDPEPGSLLTVHVYDIVPPRAHLVAVLEELEGVGLFGDLNITFEYHIRDIRDLEAEVYPCRAGGFDRTLDADRLEGTERVAGCLTARQFCAENYGEGIEIAEICPLTQVAEEPFIARCCRAEREGVGVWNKKFGGVVHWGASPHTVDQVLRDMLKEWREDEGSSRPR